MAFWHCQVPYDVECLIIESLVSDHGIDFPLPLTHTHTHTHLTALFPGLPGWAGTSKAKAIWILLKQETVSGSGIRWAICKSALLQTDEITMPAPHHSVFYRPDALSATQPTVSKHWSIPLPLIWSKIDSGRSACPVPSIDVSSLSYVCTAWILQICPGRLAKSCCNCCYVLFRWHRSQGVSYNAFQHWDSPSQTDTPTYMSVVDWPYCWYNTHRLTYILHGLSICVFNCHFLLVAGTLQIWWWETYSRRVCSRKRRQLMTTMYCQAKS